MHFLIKTCLFRTVSAAVALLPAAVSAQNPADVDAPVPAPAYVSAFANYRPAADHPASPDQVWRSANAEVGNADAHAAHAAPQETHSTGPHAGHGAHHPTQEK
jgi:hypothetical protein